MALQIDSSVGKLIDPPREYKSLANKVACITCVYLRKHGRSDIGVLHTTCISPGNFREGLFDYLTGENKTSYIMEPEKRNAKGDCGLFKQRRWWQFWK